MVIDEGKNLETRKGYTEDECKTQCSDMKGCYSFRYCGAREGEKQCFFKDKKISESTPQKPKTQCYTVYQDCEDGIYTNRINS